jgi:hypothetical protein
MTVAGPAAPPCLTGTNHGLGHTRGIHYELRAVDEVPTLDAAGAALTR